MIGCHAEVFNDTAATEIYTLEQSHRQLTEEGRGRTMLVAVWGRTGAFIIYFLFFFYFFFSVLRSASTIPRGGKGVICTCVYVRCFKDFLTVFRI